MELLQSPIFAASVTSGLITIIVLLINKKYSKRLDDATLAEKYQDLASKAADELAKATKRGDDLEERVKSLELKMTGIIVTENTTRLKVEGGGITVLESTARAHFEEAPA